MTHTSITILGGDLRFVRLAQILSENGFSVSVHGIDHPDLPSSVRQLITLEEVNGSPFIIGPIPFSKDNKYIFTPLYNNNISLEQFFTVANHSYILGGVINPTIQNLFNVHQLKWYDLMTSDELAILNAIPTAEGAIQYAMQHSEITLHHSKCLILGFGRCGKILSHKLNALGANVSVVARAAKDLAYIRTYGYRPIRLEDLSLYLSEFDFVFNTIPCCLLNSDAVDLLSPHVVYLELASAPGGIDNKYAISKGICYIPAPGLPGIVAPKTAADILYQCFLTILRNQGALI